MKDEKEVFCFDTSALIDWLERHYPVYNFPKISANMDELVDSGRFIISREVYDEAIEKDLATKNWCKPRRAKVVVETTDEIGRYVTSIMDEYALLVNDNKRKNRADPFVIALAMAKKATLVTGEIKGKGIKIPDICEVKNVKTISLIELIRQQDWIS